MIIGILESLSLYKLTYYVVLDKVEYFFKTNIFYNDSVWAFIYNFI